MKFKVVLKGDHVMITVIEGRKLFNLLFSKAQDGDIEYCGSGVFKVKRGEFIKLINCIIDEVK